MESYAALLDLFNEQIWHGFVVFLRVSVVVALLPAFGEESLPVRIKLIVAIAFTVVVAPAVEFMEIPNEVGGTARFFFSETISGALVGIGVRLFILALQTAGAIAAQSTSLSQILGGAASEPLAAIGYILTMGAMALAVLTGLHVKAAQLLIYTYTVMPAGVILDGSIVADWGVHQIGRAFELAFKISAPFILVSVIYNLALGVINKAMPQLMVAFVGAPVITAGGLLLLALASPLMLSLWLDALDVFMINPFEVGR